MDPGRVALVWEKDEPGQEERVTYSQLLEMVKKPVTYFHVETIMDSKPLGVPDSQRALLLRSEAR